MKMISKGLRDTVIPTEHEDPNEGTALNLIRATARFRIRRPRWSLQNLRARRANVETTDSERGTVGHSRLGFQRDEAAIARNGSKGADGPGDF